MTMIDSGTSGDAGDSEAPQTRHVTLCVTADGLKTTHDRHLAEAEARSLLNEVRLAVPAPPGTGRHVMVHVPVPGQPEPLVEMGTVGAPTAERMASLMRGRA